MSVRNSAASRLWRMLRHHTRFLLAAVFGIAVFLLAGGLPMESRLLVAGDGFFLAFLLAIAVLVAKSTRESLRQSATSEDEGILLIALLTLVAIGFSLSAIFMLINKQGGPDRFELALAIVSVPLGWFMLHAMAAQHYAHLYYGLDQDEGEVKTADENGAADENGPRGGLDFPGGGTPDLLDFYYFSFVVGMTAQVSDVTITVPRLRRVVLVHSIAAFFFNTVLVAIAVNAAVSVAG